MAMNLFQIMMENKGISWSIGGQADWRKFLTIPNILKEFNPKLYGYSEEDGLSHRKSSRLVENIITFDSFFAVAVVWCFFFQKSNVQIHLAQVLIVTKIVFYFLFASFQKIQRCRNWSHVQRHAVHDKNFNKTHAERSTGWHEAPLEIGHFDGWRQWFLLRDLLHGYTREGSWPTWEALGAGAEDTQR